MTLRRRGRSREIYRVYSEEEYLNGAGLGLASGSAAQWPGEEPPRAVAVDHRDVAPRRLRRVAGVTLLAGTLGAVGVIVCLNLARVDRAGAARRGDLLAATRPARPASYPSTAQAARPQTGSARSSSRPVIVRPVEAARARLLAQSRASWSGESHPGRSDRRSASPLARRSASVAVLADYPHDPPQRPAASAATPVSASAPAQQSAATQEPAATAPTPTRPAPQEAGTTTAPAPAPPVHAQPEQQAEFGFER